jgi:hypothetical protein
MIRRPESQFEETVNTLSRLTYFQRRILAWNGGPKITKDRFLYKYRALNPESAESVSQMRDLIVLSKFWLSSASDFNDPFDGLGNFFADGSVQEKRARLESLLKIQGLNWSQRQRQLSQLASRPNSYYEDEVRKFYALYYPKVGICCFAGDPRNILMWSHYANNHKGVWLQLESARDPKTFSQTISMSYSEEYPRVNWINGFYDGLKILMQRKHRGWCYERETRIRMLDSARTYHSFNPEALRAICFGCRASAQTISKIKELVTERIDRGLPRLTLYQAKLHSSKYRLAVCRFVD